MGNEANTIVACAIRARADQHQLLCSLRRASNSLLALPSQHARSEIASKNRTRRVALDAPFGLSPTTRLPPPAFALQLTLIGHRAPRRAGTR
jgi:hypothetical protein